MKPSKKSTLLIACLAVVSVLALGAFRSVNHHGDRGDRMSKRIDKILEEIDATPEQAARIREIRDQLMATRPKRDASERGELMRIFEQSEVDAEALHASIDSRFEERRAFAHRVADAMIEIHGILTPEQREKVSELMAKKAESRKGRHGKKGEGRKMRNAPATE